MYNNTCKCTTHTHTHCVYAHLTYKPLHHQGLIDIQFTQVQHYIKSRMFIVVIITHLALHTDMDRGTHTHTTYIDISTMALKLRTPVTPLYSV